MSSKSVCVLVMILTYFAFCDASSDGEIEARGKKKKIALFIYVADLIVKKIFILKLIYAFVFWVVLHKAGYFLSWFASYLKEKKHDHHEYHIPDYHSPHHEYGPSYGYGPYKKTSYN